MIFLDTSLGSKNPSKNRSRHRGPPQFKNMCGHTCSQGVENKCLRRCKTMETQRYGKLRSRTCRNNRNSCYFSPGDQNFADKTAPVLGSRNGPQNGGHSFSLNLICLCPDDLAPVLGSVSGHQNGGRFVGKIFAAGRKIVQVTIVSAGTRQKFCIPLGHWVSMVSHRREQLFSTPCARLCPHMFLNLGGPLWQPWNPLRFWRLVLGPSMDKIFARVVIRLAASHCS